MTATIQRSAFLTFEAFLDYDDGTENLYELIDGKVVEMPDASRLHHSVVKFLDEVFTQEIRQLERSWETVRNTAIRVPGQLLADGRRPDLAIVDLPKTEAEQDAKGMTTSSPHMIVEIASSNWANGVREKIFAYMHLGVLEYWVFDYIDYKGQIPEKHCERERGVKMIVFTEQRKGYGYDKTEYMGDEVIPCLTFPELQLTPNQILNRTLPD